MTSLHPKGQTGDPNTPRAQYISKWRCYNF